MRVCKINDFIEVKRSPRGGLGIYARKTILPLTMLLKEQPLIIASSEDEVLALYASLLPQQQREFDSLHWWWERNSNPILGRFKTNEFNLNIGRNIRCGAVAYMISRFNHDCDPSAKVARECKTDGNGGGRGGYLTVHAIKEINRGEEITICYTKDTERLYRDYGFNCSCTSHGPASTAVCLMEVTRIKFTTRSAHAF